ncbi:MAG: holo-ACP synthase [Vampirovibrio sp.]|nr:holo-ACP synthase [Vampirovibrio sp.]
MITDILLGTDIVNLKRLSTIHQRFGLKFFQRILTEAELLRCGDYNGENFIERAGARIAAKEAVTKALGVGLNGLGWTKGLRWKDIEIISLPQQLPTVTLHTPQIGDQDLSTLRWKLSLSHDGGYATATALGMVSE